MITVIFLHIFLRLCDFVNDVVFWHQKVPQVLQDKNIHVPTHNRPLHIPWRAVWRFPDSREAVSPTASPWKWATSKCYTLVQPAFSNRHELPPLISCPGACHHTSHQSCACYLYIHNHQRTITFSNGKMLSETIETVQDEAAIYGPAIFLSRSRWSIIESLSVSLLSDTTAKHKVVVSAQTGKSLVVFWNPTHCPVESRRRFHTKTAVYGK